MKGALSGITVIDCSRVVAGPYAGMLLGDLGANIIKVESPIKGDDGRKMTPFYGDDSCYFLLANRNKRSLTIDLKTASGKQILDRLLSTADVLIENYRPQAAKQLGLSYDILAKKFPKLIHCSITGFGATGPLSDRPAMDAMIQAFTGVMSVTGEKGRPPVRMGVALADLGAALYAAYGILAAIQARHSSGVGQKVETSLMESSVALAAFQNTSFWATGEAPQRLGSAHAAMAPLQVFEVVDGYLLVMAGTQNQWKSLCKVLGLESLEKDPRFETNQARVSHRDLLHRLIGQELIKRTKKEWVDLFATEDIQFSLVNDIGEALSEPQVLHQEMVIERDHPVLDKMKFTGFPVKFSATPSEFRMDPPQIGQHTNEIMREAGYSEEEISDLKKNGAI